MSVSEIDILERVLNSYRDEFNELADTWKQIDQKAQGTTAIAGIFLAAIFAWAQNLPSNLSVANLAILAVVALLLVLSIGCALWSMRVRNAALPPFGKSTHDMADDCCAVLSDPESVPRMLRELAASWQRANKKLAGQVDDKAHFAYYAQLVLVWAAAGAGVLAILEIAKGKTH